MLKRVDISTVVICYAGAITWYDMIEEELSNAPLHMKQEVNSKAYLNTLYGSKVAAKYCSCTFLVNRLAYEILAWASSLRG